MSPINETPLYGPIGYGQKLARASYFVRILGLYTETLSRVFSKSNTDDTFVS